MKSFILPLLLLSSFFAFGQDKPLLLKVSSDQGETLPGAAIIALDQSEKVIKSGITGVDGSAVIYLPLENITVEVKLIGYQDTTLIIMPANNGTWPPLNVVMVPSSEILEEVNVNAMAESQTISGDTTIINAEAFKVTQDASTGDLLKKMPGVEINNGSVQVQGEEVTKVFVDGKPLFGEDSKAALDLIPAEMVRGIKVYDRLSDQARFTGFKDGQTSKTIDIITKKEKRYGVFGKLNGGVGTDETYQLNTQLNLFKDKERISLILNSDNVNGTGNGLGQFVRRRGRNNPVANIPSGIATAWNAGLNYNNSWKNGLDLQAGYSFNYNDRDEQSNLTRAYILPSDSGQIYYETSTTRTEFLSHNVNLDMTWDLDTMNSIEFDPSFSFSRNKIFDNTTSSTTQGEDLLNSNLRSTNSSEDSWELDAEFLYKRKFRKEGRTFSTSLNYVNSHSDATQNLQSLGFFASRGGTNDTIEQSTQDQFNSPVLSAQLIYTEPLGESGLGEIRYEVERDRQDNDRRTYDLLASDADLVLDSILSNVFISDVYTQEYSLGYQWQPDSSDWSFSTRLGGQNVLLDNDQDLPVLLEDQRTFNAFLPYAAVFYEPLDNDFRLRLRYRTSTDVPSIGQLQQVVFNNNPLLLTTGNPDLEMSYTHDVSLRLIANDPRSSNGFFSYASFRSNENFIGSSTQIASDANPVPGLESGQQITRPVNLNGSWNARFFGYYGFPLLKGKLKGSARFGATYDETPSLINLEKNIASTFTPGISAGLASNISKELDFNLNGGVNFGQITNSLNSAADNDYRTYNGTLNIKYQPEWGLTLEADLTYTANVGLSAGFDQNFTVWNVGVGYRFLKSKRLETKLWMFDILGQNTSINRTFTSTYTQDREQLVLSRYVMLSVTWQLSKFDPSKGKGGRPGGPPGGRRGGPPRR